MQDHCTSTLARKRKTRIALALGLAISVCAGTSLASPPITPASASVDLERILVQGNSSGDARLVASARALGIFKPTVTRSTTATLPVSNCNDSGSGSLRAAVGFASSGDTVDMSGLNCVVQLNSSIVTSVDDLTLKGNPTQKYEVSGQNTIRPLTHTGVGTLTLDGFGVKLGKVTSSTGSALGGCIYSAGSVSLTNQSEAKYCTAEQTDGLLNSNDKALGGAIFAKDSVSISNSIVTNGKAMGHGHPALGGGIYAGSSIGLSGAKISSNSAEVSNGLVAKGGGLYTSGNMLAKYSSIDGNEASNGTTASMAWGGGAFVNGKGNTIKYSTFSGNTAGSAAALALAGNNGTGDDAIFNTTIANNAAKASLSKYGGALALGNTCTINSSTISGNTEANSSDNKYGAGINIAKNVSVSMSSTVVSGNNLLLSSNSTLPSDIKGNADTPASIAGNYNLTGWATDASVPAGTLSSYSPGLNSLADNGGYTKTMAVLPGSPLIDAGFDNGYDKDQRGTGFKRVYGSAADIGAYELGGDTIFANDFELPPVALHRH